MGKPKLCAMLRAKKNDNTVHWFTVMHRKWKENNDAQYEKDKQKDREKKAGTKKLI